MYKQQHVLTDSRD